MWLTTTALDQISRRRNWPGVRIDGFGPKAVVVSEIDSKTVDFADNDHIAYRSDLLATLGMSCTLLGQFCDFTL